MATVELQGFFKALVMRLGYVILGSPAATSNWRTVGAGERKAHTHTHTTTSVRVTFSSLPSQEHGHWGVFTGPLQDFLGSELKHRP